MMVFIVSSNVYRFTCQNDMTSESITNDEESRELYSSCIDTLHVLTTSLERGYFVLVQNCMMHYCLSNGI